MYIRLLFVLVFINVHDSHQVSNVREEEIRKSEQSIRKKLINVHQLDKDQQRKTIAEAVSTIMFMTVRSWVPYGAMEARSDYIYVCGNNGILQGMGILCNGVDNMKITENPGGSVQFIMPFKVCNPIYVKYKKYVQHIIMNLLHDKEGEIEIGYTKGTMEVTVVAQPPSKIVDKLNNGQCVVRVTSIRVSLSSPYSHVTIGGHLVKRLTKRHVQDILLEHLNTNGDKIEEHVRYLYYRGLLNAGDWLCLEDDGRESIKSGDNRPLYVPTSDEYKNFCETLNSS